MKDLHEGKGFGYETEEGKRCMIRCFECGRENYVATVSSGLCAWCGFNANEEALEDIALVEMAKEAEEEKE